jgi:hypothetical protein
MYNANCPLSLEVFVRRLIPVLSVLAAALLAASSVAAQDNAPPTGVDTTAPTGTEPIAGVEVTLPPGPEVTTPTLGAEQIEALPILISARADLDLLALTSLPSGILPNGWRGLTDTSNPEYPLLLRLDLELLAGSLLGAEARPEGWFGVVATKPLSIARDIRHDLELLADLVLGTPTVRPAGWTGDNPLMRCSRAAQALVALLQRQGGFTLSVDFTQPDACQQVEIQAAVFVETTVIQPNAVLDAAPAAPMQPIASGAASTFPGTHTAVGPFVIGFFDRGGRTRGGVIPDETPLTPLRRSFAPGSNMMLVEGEGFQLYVDYTFTSVSDEEFEFLPEIDDSLVTTSCDARWCENRR